MPGLQALIVASLWSFYSVAAATDKQMLPIPPANDQQVECVILLHGLVRTPASMKKMARGASRGILAPSRGGGLLRSDLIRYRNKIHNMKQLTPYVAKR